VKRTAILAFGIFLIAAPAHAQMYRYEAETGQLFSTVVANSVPGYSGTGYVTGFDTMPGGNDYVQLQVDVPDGLYEMWVGYRSPFGQKGYNYRVDSVYGSGMFDQSSTFRADRAGVFNVTGGTNTLAIYQSWGFYDVDYFEFRPFTPPTILPVSSQLADPHAGQNAQQLMNYLSSIYGQKTLAGHQHDESKNLAFPSPTYLNLSGGLRPALRSSDFMEYSPSRIAFGANPRNESEQSIAWAKQTGGAVSMTWHWNAPANLVNTQCGSNCGENDYPWWRGFYTKGTTFDLPGALANPTGSDYQLLLRDIDAIGTQLKKFQDAGVPVIWRPLHEAQGGWFWWGAHGPDTFKQLWRLTYERLTNYHDLHNLIWEFTSSAAEGNHLAWYPGDDVVDMVGLDIYTDPTSNMSGPWYDVLAHYNGRKMIALSESGTLPNADAMDTYDIGWTYFSLWKDGYLDDFPAQDVQALLGDERVITLNELPTFAWKTPGDYTNDGLIDAADYVVWRDNLNRSVVQFTVADGNGNGLIDQGDFSIWRSNYGSSFAGAGAAQTVPEPSAFVLATILLSISLHRSYRHRSHQPLPTGRIV
jgi:mannan endo-1,4-beta-mannosidase